MDYDAVSAVRQFNSLSRVTEKGFFINRSEFSWVLRELGETLERVTTEDIWRQLMLPFLGGNYNFQFPLNFILWFS